MSGLPSAGGGHGVRHRLGLPDVASEFQAPAAATPEITNKRKRRPAGTPDPDAEVVALSPKTLMESDRYVCEICNQGFQRDQNLQMHRRRHKVPWKLLKKPSTLGMNKRVYICPERSCLHHDPRHALGDLVGIKKHYRRKHCTEKQWKCVKCSKRYAVQSDYKAHLKTCGTRGHCCDCGRVFSRVESFIEHQDSCGDAKHKHSPIVTERKPPIFHQDVTDRLSYDSRSRSQSSDTTQTMSLAHSGISDTAGARSADSQSVLPPVDVDEHSRRLLETQQPAYNAALPAWLVELRSNQLARLPPSKPQAPPTNSKFPGLISDHCSFSSSVSAVSLAPPDVNTPSLSLSIGRTGSGSGSGSISVDHAPSVDMPCLRLSIGPSSAERPEMSASCCPSPYADDTKPNLGNSRESLASAPAPAPAVGLRNSPRQDYKYSSSPSSNSSATAIAGRDLALWNPEREARRPTLEAGPTGNTTPDQQTASLRDFLAQAWRPGAMQGCGSR